MTTNVLRRQLRTPAALYSKEVQRNTLRGHTRGTSLYTAISTEGYMAAQWRSVPFWRKCDYMYTYLSFFVNRIKNLFARHHNFLGRHYIFCYLLYDVTFCCCLSFVHCIRSMYGIFDVFVTNLLAFQAYQKEQILKS